MKKVTEEQMGQEIISMFDKARFSLEESSKILEELLITCKSAIEKEAEEFLEEASK